MSSYRRRPRPHHAEPSRPPVVLNRGCQHRTSRTKVTVGQDLSPHLQECPQTGQRPCPQLLGQRAGGQVVCPLDRFGGELVLAAREVVVGGGERGLRVLGQLAHARGVEPAAAHHVGRTGHEALPRLRSAEHTRGDAAEVGGSPRYRVLPRSGVEPVDEVSGDAFTALGDGEPRFRVDVTVPEGALSQRRTEGLVNEATANVLATAGLTEADALRVWVLIHEQPEGTWGAGASIVRFAELAALAKA